jgi:glycosidase
LNLLGSHDTARVLSICRGDQKRLALAMTAQFTSTGAPMIYYGDETGMEGENDPDCRRCMDWNPAHWKESLVQTTRELIRCRREHPALSSGSHETLLLFNGVYAFRKTLGEDEVLVILNPRQAQQGMSIPCRSSYSHWKDLFSGQEVTLSSTGLFLETLPEKSVLILLPDRTKTL